MQTLDDHGWIIEIGEDQEAVLTERVGTAACLCLPIRVSGYPLTSIEPDAFDRLEALQAFELEEGHPSFSVRDGVLFDRTGERLIRYPMARMEDTYEVPPTVRTICAHAFLGAAHLRRLVIPEGVVSAEARAFSDCPQLVDVTVPGSLVNVGHEVFRGSFRLNGIQIAPDHPVLRLEGDCLVDNQERILRLCLPGRGTVSLDAPEDIRFVDDYAFYGCDALEKIHFHHGLRTLGRYAFYHCEVLKTVELPDGLRSIGSRAFSGCGHMKQLYIPDSVTSIEYKAFNNCSRLVLLVNKGSYTDRYCRQFGFPCRHRIQWPWEKNT